jgi:hypothetical protein
MNLRRSMQVIWSLQPGFGLNVSTVRSGAPFIAPCCTGEPEESPGRAGASRSIGEIT